MRALLTVVFLLGFVVSLPAAARTEKKKKQEAAEPVAKGEPPALNACGCYQESGGQCHCTKKSKCGCPGECEPAGCEQKRQKELDRETQEEVKRQQEAERKRNAELQKKRDEMDRQEDAKRGKRLRGGKPVDESPEGAKEGTEEAKK
jgi:hypothetical protein